MANTVTGIVKAISGVETLQSRGGRSCTKQSVLLDCGWYSPASGERFGNDLLLDFINLREGDIKGLCSVGQRVEVGFSLRGFTYQDKEGKKRWGVNVSCRSIRQAADPRYQYAQQAQQAQQAQPPMPPLENVAPPAPGEEDLPF